MIHHEKNCKTCNDEKKNHICIHCSEVYCSIDFNHLEKHYQETKHHLYFSMDEFSIFCRNCGETVHKTTLISKNENLSNIQHKPITVTDKISGEKGEFHFKNETIFMNEVSSFFGLKNIHFFDESGNETQIQIGGNFTIIGEEYSTEIIPLKQKFKTGLIYDEQMLSHKSNKYHPENPNRITVILNDLKRSKWMDSFHILPSRKATLEELYSTHSKEYVKGVISNSKFKHHSDVYFDENTSTSALFASGSILELLDALMCGKIDNGIAITRPPGHHANSDTAMFSIFF
jgi:hypothetical protein